YNLLARIKNIEDPQYPASQKLSSTYIISSEWDLYDVSGTQFVLFIPKKKKGLFEKGFNLAKMTNMSHLLPVKPEREYEQLFKWVNGKQTPNFKSEDLPKIFLSSRSLENAPIWVFIISGHGGYEPPIIACLTPDDINTLLSYFDKHLLVGIVYVVSCFAGGKNSSLLQFTKTGVAVSHNFILIIGAISDISTSSPTDVVQFSLDFFSYAAAIQDKGESL